MKIYESGEDYLEMILMLQKEKGYARSILMDGDNLLSLTPAGEAIADRIYLRHTVLTQMFVALGVSEETARQDACKIEHDLSDETFEAIRRHLENIESQK